VKRARSAVGFLDMDKKPDPGWREEEARLRLCCLNRASSVASRACVSSVGPLGSKARCGSSGMTKDSML
jgi:hypothetical protein